MHMPNPIAGALSIAAIVLLAASPTLADDLTVGNLTAKGNTVLRDAQIDGKLGIGIINTPTANVQVNQDGSKGVGIFLGDRVPFGQALFETDLTVPHTHAWFAESGVRVFSVAGGGDGFFKGKLEVGGDALNRGDAQIEGELTIGFSKIVLKNPQPAKLRVLGNVAITADESVGGNTSVKGSTNVGKNLIVGADGLFQGGATIMGETKLGRNLTVGDPLTAGTGNITAFGGTFSIGNPFTFSGGKVTVFGTVRGESKTDDAIVGVGHTAGKSGLFGFNDNPTGGNGVAGISTLGNGNGIFGASNSAAGVGGRFSNTAPGGIALRVDGIASANVLQITGGSDVAEPFQMSRHDIPRGAVVIIDEENAGCLKVSEGAYDRRVAGIVSGANGINPGISLTQEGVLEGGQNVALSGRVYVLADASSSPIRPGDLLTTSDTPGHAMKVTDHARAQGAVIGKAMSAMSEGKGMVLVLVTLQ